MNPLIPQNAPQSPAAAPRQTGSPACHSLVVMGVAGSGKSSLAKALADTLGWDLLEGDDFHSEEGKQMMAAGQPLCPELRQQWVERICAQLCAQKNAGRRCVLSYSGLIASQRAQIRAAAWQPLFVYLQGDAAILAGRLAARPDHFMPPSMLQSQLSTMQEPTPDEAVIRLELSWPLAVATARVLALVRPEPADDSAIIADTAAGGR